MSESVRSDEFYVTMDDAYHLIKVALGINKPVMIWGPTGAGKSTIMRKIAEEMGLELIDVRLAQMAEVDLRGIPVPDTEHARTKWLVPDFFPREGCKPTLFFLDELSSALPQVQVAAYQLILDRRLGEYVLPDNVYVVAAGNGMKDRAVSHVMSSALKARFVMHIRVEPFINPKDMRVGWTKWALDHGIDMSIISFLMFKPEELYRVPKNEELAFPSGRMWEMLSNLLQNSDNLSRAQSHAMIKFCIGQITGTEFIQFMEFANRLPKKEDIIKDPENTPIPGDGDTDKDGKNVSIGLRYALAGALVNWLEKDNFDPLFKYISRLPEEFQVMIMQSIAVMRKFKLSEIPAFKPWAAKHKEVFGL